MNLLFVLPEHKLRADSSPASPSQCTRFPHCPGAEDDSRVKGQEEQWALMGEEALFSGRQECLSIYSILIHLIQSHKWLIPFQRIIRILKEDPGEETLNPKE